jgi:hypothetical protein
MIYSFDKQVVSDVLMTELKEHGLQPKNIDTVGSLLNIEFPNELVQSDVNKLNTLVDEHSISAAIERINKMEEIRGRMRHGQMVIEEFRYFTLSLPDAQSLELLVMMRDILEFVRLGVLQYAAYLMSELPAHDVLDSEYVQAGITVRQYMAARMLEGDPV